VDLGISALIGVSFCLDIAFVAIVRAT